MNNREKFIEELAKQYEVLFKADLEYAYVAARQTPIDLATKMTNCFFAGTHKSPTISIRRTCKALNIPHTNKGIQDYFNH
jgi:hypothetical protein